MGSSRRRRIKAAKAPQRATSMVRWPLRELTYGSVSTTAAADIHSTPMGGPTAGTVERNGEPLTVSASLDADGPA
jgi:hypothetical protein